MSQTPDATLANLKRTIDKNGMILRGAYLIADARLGAAGGVQQGAVAIAGDTVVDTGPFAALQPKYPGARIPADGRQLLLPGLGAAPSHGRGLVSLHQGLRNRL